MSVAIICDGCGFEWNYRRFKTASELRRELKGQGWIRHEVKDFCQLCSKDKRRKRYP